MFGSKEIAPEVNNDRFKEVSASTNAMYGRHFVLKDTETGVLYYMVQAKNNGGVGLTPLLDVDGKPIIESVD